MIKKPTLTEQDFIDAAQTLECDVAAVKAVCAVEAPRGGFNPDGSPSTLFEGHKFHKFTDGVYDLQAPDLSYPTWTRKHYGKTWQAEQSRLHRAIQLDLQAAIKSASWGKFQIMGFNHALAGFDTAEKFVDAMHRGEGEQLQAFVQFVLKTGLAPALRTQDWARFARGYNGPAYAQNNYDKKLAQAYSKASLSGSDGGQDGTASIDIPSLPGAPMVAPVVIAALAPTLIDIFSKLVPKLGTLFGSGSKVSDRNLAAVAAVTEIAKETLGSRNEQEVIETIASDPEAAATVKSAIEEKWFEIDNSGVANAQAYNLALAQPGVAPFWTQQIFYVTLLVLPLVYMAVYAVLFTDRFDVTIQAMVMGSLMTGVLGALIAYHYGSSVGSKSKSDTAARRGEVL